MKSIAEKIQAVIKCEEEKRSGDKTLQDYAKLVDQMEKLGSIKKPEYTLPLVDTIGKTDFSNWNKRIGI